MLAPVRRRSQRLALASVLVLVGVTAPGRSFGVVPSAQAAAVPTCHGVSATLVGTKGDDDLRGTAGADVIVGLAGNDYIEGMGGDDLICGGRSRTRVEPFSGEEVNQWLSGGGGDDLVIGGAQADDVYGGGGDDEMYGRRGADYLSGDSDKQPGVDRLFGGQGSDYLDGMYADDELYGGRGGDELSDAVGSNVEFGGRGDDLLFSGPADEDLHGGRGRDVVDYTLVNGGEGHCNDVRVDLSAGTGTGKGFGTDTLTNIDGAYSTGGRDVLIGDDGPNLFYAGADPCGRSATDRVDGRDGQDTISFATELVQFGSAFAPVHVDLAAGEAESRSGGNVNRTILVSIENVDGTGDYRDVLLGNDEANVFNGGWTRESYLGNDGDVISGRDGADVLKGMGGGDHLYGGRGPDSLVGRAGADHLYGRRGADELQGQRGGDLLDGGRGRNQNTGGKGHDVCRHPASGPRARSCEAR